MKTNNVKVLTVMVEGNKVYGTVECSWNTLKSSTFNHTIAKGKFIWKLDGEPIEKLLEIDGTAVMIHAAKVRETSAAAMDKLNGGTFTLAQLDELIGVGDRTGTKVKVVMDLFKSRNMTKEQAEVIVNSPEKWAKVQKMLEDVDI
jgi:hypothetical protein